MDPAKFSITWTRHQGFLELSEVTLTDADREKITRDALLLLPPSFTDEWLVDLIVPALNYCQSGLLVKDPFYWQGLLGFPELSGNDTAGNQRVNRENTSCFFELSTELLMNLSLIHI